MLSIATVCTIILTHAVPSTFVCTSKEKHSHVARLAPRKLVYTQQCSSFWLGGDGWPPVFKGLKGTLNSISPFRKRVERREKTMKHNLQFLCFCYSSSTDVTVFGLVLNNTTVHYCYEGPKLNN